MINFKDILNAKKINRGCNKNPVAFAPVLSEISNQSLFKKENLQLTGSFN